MDEITTGTGLAAPGSFDAVSAFDSLLSVEDGTQDDEATPEANATAKADEMADAQETESAELEGTESESNETDSSEEPAPSQRFTVRIDGKEETVELSELLSGYSRTADYTRKTQAIANERKTLEAEAVKARQERAEYSQLLPKLRAAIEAGMGVEPNWEELRERDPVRASVEWQRWQERKAKIATVSAEEARIKAAEAEEMAAQRNAILIEQRQKLLERLPTWKDPKVATKESELVTHALKAHGFGDDELSIYDHRAMIIALKAAKYDQLMSQRPALQAKVAKAPVVKPGGGSAKTQTAASAARDRFMKSGSVQDAASLFTHLV
jgi:hypothetical protein